ncbi:MAG: hypothetical protein ACP5L1_10000, partial [Caldivirga sp.]|uniref:hypothetical protein n=1 Tax=Caldivirga sp. TaxID=2080243 RepID=UPI003D0B6E9E
YTEAFAAAFLDTVRHARGSVFTLSPYRLLQRARELGYMVNTAPVYATVMRHYILVMGKIYPFEALARGRGVIYMFETGDFKDYAVLTPRQLAILLKVMEDGALGPSGCFHNSLRRDLEPMRPPIMVG